MSYAELYAPQKKISTTLYNLALILCANLLIALSAQLSFHLPFSPVPITGQTLTVLLLAALLGKKRGLAAILLYLGEGALGMPVFAGGQGGLGVLIGPTGGYLLGFAAATFLVGSLIDRGWDRRIWTSTLAMLLGNLVIYICGLAWLSTLVAPDQVLALGLYPFLVGDALKITLAAGVLAASGSRKPPTRTERSP